MSSQCQTTLAAPVELSGRGLHGGEECRLTIRPAGADYGVRFRRSDLNGAPEIPALIGALSEETLIRQTVLRSPEDREVSVMTVEHILASLSGLGVDNALVEMTASEPPIWDGSAQEPTAAIRGAGIATLEGSARRSLRVDRPLRFSPEDSPGVVFTAWPSEGLTISYFLEQNHPFIGSQAASFRIDPESYEREIAPSRTWCTFEEVEFLRSQDLIKGGSAENAIVVGQDKILNTELKWENELARHKLLDLLGDLALLGVALKGHITSHRGGHHANAQFVQYLRKELK